MVQWQNMTHNSKLIKVPAKAHAFTQQALHNLINWHTVHIYIYIKSITYNIYIYIIAI